MDHVEFTIPGRLKGKGRPKFARRGNFVQAYTPADTVSAESMVRRFAAEAMAGRRAFECALVLEVSVTLNTPPSWSKRKRAEARYVTGKPDCDNVIKLLGDSLNGIVWRDDALIADIHFQRRYDDSAPEHVRIRVYQPDASAVRASVCNTLFGAAA